MIVTCADRHSWLAERAKGEHPIGSSDVPRILGTSPYGGPWSVWAAHHHPDWQEEIDAPHLQAGLDDEPKAIALYIGERYEGGSVDHRPWRLARRDGWMTCSPDALVLPRWFGDVLGGVEVKHFDHEDLADWAPSGAEWRWGGARPCPRFVLQQATWCAIVVGTPWWDICAALGTGRRYPELRIYRVHVCNQTRAWMIGKVAAWRERHLVHGHEPPYDTPDEHLLSVARRYPRQERAEVVEADADAAELLAELAATRAAREAAEAREAELKARVQELIGDRKGLRSAAWSASWSTPGQIRRLSGLSRIEAEHPDLVPELERRGLITTAHTARRLTLRPRSKA